MIRTEYLLLILIIEFGYCYNILLPLTKGRYLRHEAKLNFTALNIHVTLYFYHKIHKDVQVGTREEEEIKGMTDLSRWYSGVH